MSPNHLSNGADLSQVQDQDSSPPPPSLRLKEALTACSAPFETGDFAKSDEAVAVVVGLLDSIVEPPAPDSEAAASPSESDAEEALVEIHRYLSSPSSNQMAVDALSFELPRVVVKFASRSDSCREIVGIIIDCLVSICSPRDMLAILCEALDTHGNVSKAQISYVPLLKGLSKVFLCIQRLHVKQVKAALPIILGVLNAVSLEFTEEDDDSLNDIFGAAISIGTSIQAICQNLVERREELCAILGLFVLQNIALITRSRQANIISSCSSLVIQFSHFLPFCGLSYLDLITGCNFAAITDEVSKEDDDNFMSSFSLVIDGASLSVIWGHISDEVAKAAGEQLSTVLDSIRSNRTKRWQAVGVLRSTLSSIDYSWEIKSHSIGLLLSMMDGSTSEDINDNHIDFSSFVASLFAALQAIQRIMIGASDGSLRKKAFDALRKVVSDLPSSERFDILKALVTNSNSPSMIAILIDMVKEEFVMANCQKCLPRNDETKRLQNKTAISHFWNPDALDLVELVLKPSKGGPPSLPEQAEPVLAALNLYRFVLMVESTGKTNRTGVLSEETLRKAYSEWLLPLRTLVSATQAENERDGGELAECTLCALNPVQLVLHHCIQLVEDNLQRCK